MQGAAVTRNADGTVSWHHIPGDTYLVIGRTPAGKRVRMVMQAWLYAAAVNLWSGRKYLVRNGKRFLLTTVTN